MFARLFTVQGYRYRLRWNEAELRSITTPVTLVWGSTDAFGSLDLARRAAAAMPHASLEVLDAGHIPFFDDPARCAEILRGLAARVAA